MGGFPPPSGVVRRTAPRRRGMAQQRLIRRVLGPMWRSGKYFHCCARDSGSKPGRLSEQIRSADGSNMLNYLKKKHQAKGKGSNGHPGCKRIWCLVHKPTAECDARTAHVAFATECGYCTFYDRLTNWRLIWLDVRKQRVFVPGARKNVSSNTQT